MLSNILIIAGILNIFFILLILLSCRCLTNGKLALFLSRYKWFMWLHLKHCQLWWLFFTSVLVHTFIAFYLIN
ncbi:hypothetical protein HOE31_04415 [bacterium]|nr:hypothetical protein [bacterium]MBT4122163.1 hypothetical protein [bacterium]MBT4335297.1 hypothetical protein [bacterium]MBT4495628.1 hypothetical protein [bacterium]MBT5942270.1 hypothetical protein [bacterium]